MTCPYIMLEILLLLLISSVKNPGHALSISKIKNVLEPNNYISDH